MKINIIEINGTYTALFGLGLSYGITSECKSLTALLTDTDLYNRLLETANRLAHKQGGHNKFLESINITLDITAPRYWWSEFDTYRVGVTKQSESTIHTLGKRDLTADDFEHNLPFDILTIFNNIIDRYRCTENKKEKENLFLTLKNLLPEGYLQRRIVVLNAKTLQNIIAQRINHRLPEWKQFCDTLRNSLPFHICSWVFPEGHTAE